MAKMRTRRVLDDPLAIHVGDRVYLPMLLHCPLGRVERELGDHVMEVRLEVGSGRLRHLTTADRLVRA